jgi:hypothetical protein
MHGEGNETARALSADETLMVGGGQENWFYNGNFVRYTSSALGNVVVVETTYLGAPLDAGAGAPPMHGRLQG